MDIKVISLNVGRALLVNALFMLISMFISIGNGMDSAFSALAISFIITLIVGSFPFIFVKKAPAITLKEGFVTVVLAWLLSFIFGMLPYVLWGGQFTIINALFESVSGYTTTGCTILTEVESLPRSLLFWRASTHFIGGLGVVVFLLLVIPESSPFRLKLTNIEMSSLSKDGYRYRSSKKVYVILTVYLAITAGAALSLWIAGMPFYDAVCTSFSLVSTGGFTVKNASIASYDSTAINLICMVFMMLAATHFGVLYASFITKSLKPFKSPVVKYFYIVTAVFAVIASVSLKAEGTFPTWGEAFMHGSFLTVSYITTTGVATAHNALWPTLTSVIFVIASIHCGCSGSTTGGIKADRALIAIKGFKHQIRRYLHPNAVSSLKIGTTNLREDAVLGVMQFIVIYALILMTSTSILLCAGLDIQDAFSGTVCTLGNVGIALGDIGSLGNFSTQPFIAKAVFTVNMILGRLEIYPVLIVIYMMFKRIK